MDTKFIITREYRELCPGDFFSFDSCSFLIRRFDFFDGTTFYFTTVRYRNKDVNVSGSVLSFRPYGYVCKPRSL